MKKKPKIIWYCVVAIISTILTTNALCNLSDPGSRALCWLALLTIALLGINNPISKPDGMALNECLKNFKASAMLAIMLIASSYLFGAGIEKHLAITPTYFELTICRGLLVWGILSVACCLVGFGILSFSDWKNQMGLFQKNY